MSRRIKHVFHTSVFYGHFILWGLSLTFIGVPLVSLLAFVYPKAKKMYIYFVAGFYRSLIALLRFVRAIEIESFEGTAYLYKHKPCIYVSNHRTMLDVLIFFSRLWDTNCLVKAGPSPRRMVNIEETDRERKVMPGWWAPFIASSLKVLGYIRMPKEKSDMAGLKNTIEECRRSLREGRSIIIFPEGTRSNTGKLLPFITLPFRLASEENIPIVPMVIYNDIPIMPKGMLSIDVPRPARFRIRVLPPIFPDERMDTRGLLMKTRKLILKTLKEFETAADTGNGNDTP